MAPHDSEIAAYLPLGALEGMEQEGPDFGCDDSPRAARLVPDGPLQQCGVCVLCTVLMCYFLPMLSFIPLALFGGLQMPNPWAPGYNNHTGMVVVRPPTHAVPTGSWYWDMPTALLVLVGFPTGVLVSAYFLKERSLAASPLTQPLDLES